MKTQIGLWIDHKKAIIVAVTDKGEETRLIISKVERQLRRSGDSPLEGAYDEAQVSARDSRQRSLTAHLNIYYEAVIASIRGAEAMLIFGPGEVKGELKKRLKKAEQSVYIQGLLCTSELFSVKISSHYHDVVVITVHKLWFSGLNV